MKVLHINDYASRGGAEVVIAKTIDLLRIRGIDARLFTIDDVPGHRRTAFSYIDNRAARRALRAKLQAFQPQVIHLHNIYHELSPGVLAAITGFRPDHACTVVMTAHDYHLVCPNSGGSWFRAAPSSRGASGSARESIMRTIDPQRVQSIGDLLTRRWDHRGLGYSTLRLLQHLWNYRVFHRQRVIDALICPSRLMQRLIRNAGLRAMHLPHAAPSIAAGAGDQSTHRYGRLRLVFAGRIEPEKGLCRFLTMLPEDFAGVISIIGDGSELDRCRAIVKKLSQNSSPVAWASRPCSLSNRRDACSTSSEIVSETRGMNDRVEFLGRLPHAQTLAIIARCHVLVLPSLCLENYPLSLIEALAAGTNILVSDRGGMREIVDDFGVGFIFNPDDQDSVCNAMRRIDQQHRDGVLNAFDVDELMSRRSENAHIDQLIRIYRGDVVGSL